MTYSVGPFDKHKQEESTHRPYMAWSYQVLAKDTHSASPSQLQLWWFKEDDKRKRGIFNEIDVADIKWALKGGKNGWSERVNRNPKLFQTTRNQPLNWQAIKEIL